MTLNGYVHAFSKYMDIELEEAVKLVGDYAVRQHAIPDGIFQNPLRHLQLVPFDDGNPAWVRIITQSIPQSVPKKKVKAQQRQHPSFYFFKDYVETLERQVTSVEEEEGEKADKDDATNVSVRLPPVINFRFRETLVFGDEEMDALNWTRLIRERTSEETSSDIPWAPRDAGAWATKCQKLLRFDVSTEKANDVKKHSVAAFSLIDNADVRRALFQPEFRGDPLSIWHTELFSTWQQLYLNKSKAVSISPLYHTPYGLLNVCHVKVHQLQLFWACLVTKRGMDAQLTVHADFSLFAGG